MEIYRGCLLLLDEHQPEAMGIEQLFFSTNQKTAMAVAEARGVLLLAAAERGVALIEISPGEMKFNIAGYGGADKRGVQKMVRLILREPLLRVIDDASDALALAILASRPRPEGVD
jgi:crossover junction endodeoxyribonuclease RuvC